MLRCLEDEFLSLSTRCAAVSSICAAAFSNMCSARAEIAVALLLPVSLVGARPKESDDAV
jgi:hypothetical protein